ncbi:hypothetical protein [Bradyrhizobium sp. SZCCHNR2032]|uniref:hypothetical protein n=1 Tax=Bradyrhizobium sp. SZCCHNR2032 TaxID=3057384 RepID=UPI0029162DDF|nr:hypothetical protein [Bradyrhizobium sp. SZCCHNR2032]
MMKQVSIVLIHDDTDYLSDRSLRDLLKQLSRTIRRTQLKEVERLLNSADLDKREVQSLLATLEQKGQTVPTYYLNSIKHGSLEAVFFIAAGYLGKLAGEIVGKVIDDVVRQNKLYKHLLKSLDNHRQKSFAESLKEELGSFVAGRFAIEDIAIAETKNSILVNVELTTQLEFQDRLPEQYDEARVIALLKTRIRETSESGT